MGDITYNMPQTTITKTERERDDGIEAQYTTTVPKGLAESLGLDGSRIEWEIVDRETLMLHINGEHDNDRS